MKALLLLLFLFFTAFAFAERYQRKAWPHWSDMDRNCRNTRHEVLSARSLVPVSFNRRRCKVVAGKWEDFYYPETHTLAKQVDLDHLVPLKNAHENGGANWTRARREAFANDPENLVITSRKYNREKGAKDPGSWLPLHRNYACRYVKRWVKIKEKYNLTMPEPEKKAIELLSTCDLAPLPLGP